MSWSYVRVAIYRPPPTVWLVFHGLASLWASWTNCHYQRLSQYVPRSHFWSQVMSAGVEPPDVGDVSVCAYCSRPLELEDIS